MISSDLRSQTLKKNGGPTEFGSNGHKSGQDKVFCYFLEFGSYVFLETAYSDSPWQCLTSSGGKTDEKSLEAQTWATQAKIGAEISFLVHFLRFGLLVFFDIAQDCSLEQCLMSSRAKTYQQWQQNCGPNKGLTDFPAFFPNFMRFMPFKKSLYLF